MKESSPKWATVPDMELSSVHQTSSAQLQTQREREAVLPGHLSMPRVAGISTLHCCRARGTQVGASPKAYQNNGRPNDGTLQRPGGQCRAATSLLRPRNCSIMNPYKKSFPPLLGNIKWIMLHNFEEGVETIRNVTFDSQNCLRCHVRFSICHVHLFLLGSAGETRLQIRTC
jgi:hypothetical protein